MTTLLREFEDWLKDSYHQTPRPEYREAIKQAKDKLEALKKKYNV